MVANQSTHLWLSRFCLRLMDLEPGTSVRRAITRAVAAYPYADDLEPEAAAALLVASSSDARRSRAAADATR